MSSFSGKGVGVEAGAAGGECIGDGVAHSKLDCFGSKAMPAKFSSSARLLGFMGNFCLAASGEAGDNGDEMEPHFGLIFNVAFDALWYIGTYLVTWVNKR